jgi:putative spermidine/putrescine transport system ATP-binding protein
VPATPVGAVDEGEVIAAIRPDDLAVSATGSITATVESAQYHGHSFYCSGRTADGSELYFQSDRRVSKGETVRLTADPGRVLIYSRATA